METVKNITSYNQIDHISLYIKTTKGIQEVELKGNIGINIFRSLFNRLEAKHTGSGIATPQPKKIVIDDSPPAKNTVMKKRVKKIQAPEELDYIENIEDTYDLEEDFDNDLIISETQPKNPNEINLNRSNVLNLNYTPASGEMSATQAGKLMASQSGFGFGKN